MEDFLYEKPFVDLDCLFRRTPCVKSIFVYYESAKADKEHSAR
jgi:hypothetical protein